MVLHSKRYTLCYSVAAFESGDGTAFETGYTSQLVWAVMMKRNGLPDYSPGLKLCSVSGWSLAVDCK